VKTVSYGHNLLGTFRQLAKNRDNAHDLTTVPATEGLSAGRKLIAAHGLEVSVGNLRGFVTRSQNL
jgi:hypothetical protein